MQAYKEIFEKRVYEQETYRTAVGTEQLGFKIEKDEVVLPNVDPVDKHWRCEDPRECQRVRNVNGADRLHRRSVVASIPTTLG